jgi:hypothetical protein
MVRSPAGRRAPRTGGPTPEQWLEVPGWRRPVDTLLVLAVTFATAWVGLVVIPAAANNDTTTVTDRSPDTENDAAPPTVDPTTDPSQWFAGPVYTGGPAAPTTEQAVPTEAVVVAAPRTTAPRFVPKRTTTHAAPRTTRPPAPKTTVAPVVAAAVPPAVTTAATTTDPTTAVTTTPSATDTTTETTTSSTTEPTTTSPATSTSEPAPAA